MINEFYKNVKKIYELNDVTNSKNFLEKSLFEAINNKDTSLIIAILNEMIGFFRDITDYEEGLKYTKSLINIISRHSMDNYSLFICYINIGNFFRASLNKEEAIKYFDNAIKIYNENNINDKTNLAALYNNYALLYNDDVEKSLFYLTKALELIKESNDPIKLATTYVNIGLNYLNIDSNKTLDCIKNAREIFKDNLNDFHISGYYNLCAKYYNKEEDYIMAKEYYHKSLIHLQKTVGKNEVYNFTLKELYKVYDILGIPYHKRGLLLSKEYYLSIEDKLLDNIPKRLYKNICIGLFGLGSECYKLDDIISEDHDFEPNIIILVDDNVSNEDYNIILNSYNKLEKEYDRYFISGLDKHGIHYVNEYLHNYLGVIDLNNISNESASVITNGEIFYGNNSFVKLRNELKNKLKYKFIPELIYKSLEINQIFYNLDRLEKRNDNLTISLLNNRLLDYILDLTYIENLLYKPHDKLAIKYISSKKNNHLLWIYNVINKQYKLVEEDIINYILDLFSKYNIIKNRYSNYIEDYKEELLNYIDKYNINIKLINEIVEYEWNMFTNLKNIGKRANCQDNYTYFKLMRESQYFTWNTETLTSYLSDLKIAKENNYSLLELKYAFMEENIDIDLFNSFKDRLPKISNERKNIQEEIIKLQVSHMEEYSKIYPNVTSNMRNIYSVLDTEDSVSYETYLRGELSTYSEKTLYNYGRMLAQYELEDKNYVEVIINFTNLLK